MSIRVIFVVGSSIVTAVYGNWTDGEEAQLLLWGGISDVVFFDDPDSRGLW